MQSRYTGSIEDMCMYREYRELTGSSYTYYKVLFFVASHMEQPPAKSTKATSYA